MSRTVEQTIERNMHLKELRKLKKARGECAWFQCTNKTDKRLFGVQYSYCPEHRKYFKEYQKLNGNSS